MTMKSPKTTIRRAASQVPTAEDAIRLIRAALGSVDDTLSANEAINIITGVCSRYNSRLSPFPAIDVVSRDFLSGKFARTQHARRTTRRV